VRITSIQRPRRKRRYEVLVDYVLVVPLSPEVLAQAQLRTGQEVTDEELTRLEAAEARHSAMAAALRLLAYRPRSEKEVRDALRRRRVRSQVLDGTIARLRELRLLDDADFARSYVDLRDRASPRSRRLLQSELLARGVDRQSAEAPLGEVDEEDAAYRAAARRARSLSALAFLDFQRRLGDHLQRRGFGYETAREAVRRLWVEVHGEVQGDDDIDGALQ
jgi:regulatory protein